MDLEPDRSSCWNQLRGIGGPEIERLAAGRIHSFHRGECALPGLAFATPDERIGIRTGSLETWETLEDTIVHHDNRLGCELRFQFFHFRIVAAIGADGD